MLVKEATGDSKQWGNYRNLNRQWFLSCNFSDIIEAIPNCHLHLCTVICRNWTIIVWMLAALDLLKPWGTPSLHVYFNAWYSANRNILTVWDEIIFHKMWCICWNKHLASQNLGCKVASKAKYDIIPTNYLRAYWNHLNWSYLKHLLVCHWNWKFVLSFEIEDIKAF